MHLLEKTDAVDRWINDAALEFVGATSFFGHA